jgi:hypothetical protein
MPAPPAAQTVHLPSSRRRFLPQAVSLGFSCGANAADRFESLDRSKSLLTNRAMATLSLTSLTTLPAKSKQETIFERI